MKTDERSSSSLVDVAGYSREDRTPTEACFYVVNNFSFSVYVCYVQNYRFADSARVIIYRDVSNFYVRFPKWLFPVCILNLWILKETACIEHFLFFVEVDFRISYIDWENMISAPYGREQTET